MALSGVARQNSFFMYDHQWLNQIDVHLNMSCQFMGKLEPVPLTNRKCQGYVYIKWEYWSTM